MLVETIPHGIAEFDARGGLTLANAACHRIMGRAEGDLKGTHLWETVARVSKCRNVGELIADLVHRRPEPVSHVGRITAGDSGTDVRIDWDYKRDHSGKITGFVAVLTDLTEQHRAEEESQQRLDQLAHVERLSIMSEMVSGLAHELNQPLAAVNNYAQVCRHLIHSLEETSRSDLADAVEQIVEQAGRAGQIIRHLRTFVRRADAPRSTVNINDVVRDAVDLLKVEARLRQVSLETILGDPLPAVVVERTQIEQVIISLANNAMEAMRQSTSDEHRVRVRTSMRADGMLEVAVEDNGGGLRAENIDRLFEPFYTTKTSGMGLGLSISRSIIEAHGGRLGAVPSTEDRTTFRFALPVESKGDPK